MTFQNPSQGSPSSDPATSSLQSALSTIARDQKEALVRQRATASGLDYADLAVTPLNPDGVALLRRSDMEAAHCVVISRIGKRLRLGVVDPQGTLKDGIVRHLEERGYVVRLVLLSEESFTAALPSVQRYGQPDSASDGARARVEVYEAELERFKGDGQRLSTLSASDMIRTVIQEAYATGASDIHFDPQEDGVRLRFRIDGLVQEVLTLPLAVYRQFVNQLKYECGMKLNESHLPQDGRLNVPVAEEDSVDVRIATLPTLSGETVAMRVLDARKKLFTLGELGFVEPVLSAIQSGLHARQGMVLVVGPTGSGKTTSLYTFLKALQKPENRIVTLEDPIEYHLPGIAQSQVETDRGYDFVTGLKALVRQDPDIIMVGEIREAETARIAFQAALTGHMVLTSLHAAGVVESIARLLNIGLQPFMIAPALELVIAQRLIRKLCVQCRESTPTTPAEREHFHALLPVLGDPPKALYRASSQGCPACSHTGYHGRTAIVETMRVDEPLRSLIAAGVSPERIQHELAERHPEYLSMRAYGWLRAAQGVTSVEEVERVTGEEAPHQADAG